MMDNVSLAKSLGLKFCEYGANYREFDFHGEKIKVFEWQAENFLEARRVASEKVFEALVNSIKQNLKG